jgi:hypothetical protein
MKGGRTWGRNQNEDKYLIEKINQTYRFRIGSRDIKLDWSDDRTGHLGKESK